jgi:hypothetical protein
MFERLVNGGHNFIGQTIIIGDSIDIQGHRRNQWMPIGTYASRFEGTFDGNGNTIGGIYINQPNMGELGLFGVVGKSGIIRNLNIANVYIRGGNAVGGVVGRNYGAIENCHAGESINVKSKCGIFGQLVGYNGGRVSNSRAMWRRIQLIGYNGTSSVATQFSNQPQLQAQQTIQIHQQSQIQGQFFVLPTYKSVLTEAGLSEYIPLFEEHRITDLDMIRSLTNDEFREMGVAIGDRRRITEAFAHTQSQQQESSNQQMQALKEPISLPPLFRRILVEGGLGEYVHILERYGIANINMLRSLTREQLREMGIEAMFDQIAKLGAKGVQRGTKAIRR